MCRGLAADHGPRQYWSSESANEKAHRSCGEKENLGYHLLAMTEMMAS